MCSHFFPIKQPFCKSLFSHVCLKIPNMKEMHFSPQLACNLFIFKNIDLWQFTIVVVMWLEWEWSTHKLILSPVHALSRTEEHKMPVGSWVLANNWTLGHCWKEQKLFFCPMWFSLRPQVNLLSGGESIQTCAMTDASPYPLFIIFFLLIQSHLLLCHRCVSAVILLQKL